ncbi:MAG TPA: response regulator transcription factor [Solirubrobacteraceae bacterium]
MSALAQQSVSTPGASPSSQLNVLIADDHPLVIAGIRRTIEHLDDIRVVGEAHSGPELLQLIERRRPDVVLMDLRMPGVGGTELIQQIRRQWPQIAAIVLSACDDRPTIDAALDAGASAYVLKTAGTADVASVLRQAMTGGGVQSPKVVPFRRGDAAARGGPSLTDRERSILSAVATGLTTAAISRDLWISEHTIKFHLTNIYRKLGVPNRAGAVRYALEHGIG